MGLRKVSVVAAGPTETLPVLSGATALVVQPNNNNCPTVLLKEFSSFLSGKWSIPSLEGRFEL
jgi:hypothetical protein